MDPSNKPLDRLLCAEPLECRWLLSGVAPPSLADVSGARWRVDVVDIGPADEGADEDVEISPSALPDEVVDAFNERFPGAEIEEAEREIEEGQVEYDVVAEVEGTTVDVSIAPDGQILEVEQFVPSNELPQVVIDWLRQFYGEGAEIDEASVVIDGRSIGYELAVTPANSEPQEAELDLTPVDVGDNVPPATSADLFADAGESEPALGEVDELLVQEADAPSITPAALEPAPAEPPAPARENAQPDKPATQQAWTATIVDVASGPAASALQALAAGTGASVWLPQAAGVIDELSASVDLAGVEQKLQDVIGEIEAMATKATTDATDTTEGHGALHLAVAAAVVAAAQLILIRLRLPKGGPVLVFNSISSSWSWILGNSSSERE